MFGRLLDWIESKLNKLIIFSTFLLDWIEPKLNKLIIFSTFVLIIVAFFGFMGILSSMEIHVFQDVNFSSKMGNISVVAGFETIGPFIPNKEIQLKELQVDLNDIQTKKIHIQIYPSQGESSYVTHKSVNFTEEFKKCFFWSKCRSKFNKTDLNEYISFRKGGEQSLVCKIRKTWTETSDEWICLDSKNNISVLSPTSPEAIQFRGFKYKEIISFILAILLIPPGMSSLRELLLKYFESRKRGFYK